MGPPTSYVEGLPRFEPVGPLDSALQVRDGLFAMVQELFGIKIHPVHAEAPPRCAACCTSSCCMHVVVLHAVRCVSHCMLCFTLSKSTRSTRRIATLHLDVAC